MPPNRATAVAAISAMSAADAASAGTASARSPSAAATARTRPGPPAHQDHAGPLGREPLRHGRADAGPGAGDHRHPAVQPSRGSHGYLPCGRAG